MAPVTYRDLYLAAQAESGEIQRELRTGKGSAHIFDAVRQGEARRAGEVRGARKDPAPGTTRSCAPAKSKRE